MKKVVGTLLLVAVVLNGFATTARALPPDRIDETCIVNPAAPECPVTIRSVNGSLGSVSLVVEPLIVDGRLYLPVRPLARALEAQVDWDGVTGTVTVTKLRTMGVWTRVSLQPGKAHRVIVSGFQNSTPYRVHSFIQDGATRLPFRFLAEALDVHVSWDGSTKTVVIDHARPAEISEPVLREQMGPMSALFRPNEFGWFGLAEPEDGYPANPTVIAHFRHLAPKINDFIKETRNDPDHFAIINEPSQGRTRVRDSRTDQPIMDVYGTHVVVWMNKQHAIQYMSEIRSRGQGGGIAVTLITVIGSMIAAGPAFVTKTLMLGLAIAGAWYGVKTLDADKTGTCLALAEAYYSTDSHKQETLRIGIVHGLWSAYCVDHYTDEPIRVDHPLLTRVEIGKDPH